MRIDNQPIREAVQKKGIPLHQLAEFMGIANPSQGSQTIARSLGLEQRWDEGKIKRSTTMDHDWAVRIIRAAHIDPVDVGL